MRSDSSNILVAVLLCALPLAYLADRAMAQDTDTPVDTCPPCEPCPPCPPVQPCPTSVPEADRNAIDKALQAIRDSEIADTDDEG